MQEQTTNGSELKANEKSALVPFSPEKPVFSPTPTNGTAIKLKSPSAVEKTADTVIEEKPRIGFKGYLRLLTIFLSFFLFAARLLWNRRDWRLRKIIPDSKTFHTEGAKLREKLI